MEEAQKKVTKVEELQDFPFKDYEEFKKAYDEGTVRVGVDPTIAREWLLRRGKYCHSLWFITGIIFSWIPFLIMLSFIIFMIFHRPILLFSFPLLVVAFLLSSPHSKKTLGGVRTLIIGGFVVALIYFFAIRSDWMWVFGAMVSILICLGFLNSFAQECFFLSIYDYEDLLTELYQKGIICLKLKDGRIVHK